MAMCIKVARGGIFSELPDKQVEVMRRLLLFTTVFFSLSLVSGLSYASEEGTSTSVQTRSSHKTGKSSQGKGAGTPHLDTIVELDSSETSILKPIEVPVGFVKLVEDGQLPEVTDALSLTNNGIAEKAAFVEREIFKNKDVRKQVSTSLKGLDQEEQTAIQDATEKLRRSFQSKKGKLKDRESEVNENLQGLSGNLEKLVAIHEQYQELLTRIKAIQDARTTLTEAQVELAGRKAEINSIQQTISDTEAQRGQFENSQVALKEKIKKLENDEKSIEDKIKKNDEDRVQAEKELKQKEEALNRQSLDCNSTESEQDSLKKSLIEGVQEDPDVLKNLGLSANYDRAYKRPSIKQTSRSRSVLRYLSGSSSTNKTGAKTPPKQSHRGVDTLTGMPKGEKVADTKYQNMSRTTDGRVWGRLTKLRETRPLAWLLGARKNISYQQVLELEDGKLITHEFTESKQNEGETSTFSKQQLIESSSEGILFYGHIQQKYVMDADDPKKLLKVVWSFYGVPEDRDRDEEIFTGDRLAKIEIDMTRGRVYKQETAYLKLNIEVWDNKTCKFRRKTYLTPALSKKIMTQPGESGNRRRDLRADKNTAYAFRSGFPDGNQSLAGIYLMPNIPVMLDMMKDIVDKDAKELLESWGLDDTKIPILRVKTTATEIAGLEEEPLMRWIKNTREGKIYLIDGDATIALESKREPKQNLTVLMRGDDEDHGSDSADADISSSDCEEEGEDDE